MSTAESAFRRYLVAGLAALPVYFLLPSAVQNLAILATNLVALVTVVVVWHRRRLRPTAGWLLLAAFPAATAVGNVVYFVNDSVLGVQPFPSIGDAAFLGGYLFLAAGLLRLQHARSTGRDLPAVLDTAIITVGFAAASWVFFISPLVHDETSSTAEQLVALGYPVADVIAVAVTARFFLTSRRRGPVFAWLAGTVLVMLVADTAFAVLNLLGLYGTGHPVDALILAYNLGWGAVALHRGAADLTLPPQEAVSRPGIWRLVALVAASLVAPAVLIYQLRTGRTQDVLLVASAAALLFLLVVSRMAVLVRQLESVLAQRQALQVELQHRAHHDDLTGLANRRAFVDAVEAALEERRGDPVQVLFLDLDRFKAVNDSLGHGAGDVLLTTVAARLQAVLRPGDTVARLGGDEFAVLLGETPVGRSLPQTAAALAAAVEQPVLLQGLDVQVSASVGTAQAGRGDSLEDLMHRADTEMYAHKMRTDRRANAGTTPPVPSQDRPTGAPLAP